jgi:hypothetical protein
VASEKITHDAIKIPPFETDELRKKLLDFLDSSISPDGAANIKIGDVRWGVYAFYDYDGEPIYVGQTNEKIRTRIRRHLTNQRTDAVAMSVLDPFEVFEIAVWPLHQYQETSSKDKDAKSALDALEYHIYQQALDQSEFKVVLNEKNPPKPVVQINIPTPARHKIVSEEVFAIRSHPDVRIARRALVIARLAQVISERKIQGGLRRVLLAQAKRLQWLANRRFEALGGQASVVRKGEEKDNSDD